MSIVKNRENIKYYIGVDIGTNSVGWAVIDENGNLLKKGKHHLWGSRLFDQAQTAQNRRNYRSSRRRYNKRRQRIGLLRLIMSDMVLEVDPSFFIRLEKTTFLDKEDKKAILKDNYKMNYNLFCDEDYNDKKYFKDYPTIYHLRKKLCESDEKADPRLIYLALHHIVKYRGNFLYEGQELHLEPSNKEEDLKILFNMLSKNNDTTYDISDEQIQFILKTVVENISKTAKVDECMSHLKLNSEDKKIVKEFMRGLVGNKFNVSKLYMHEDLQFDDEDLKLQFSDKSYEEKIMEYENVLEEKMEFIDLMQQFYSWIELSKIVGSDSQHASISGAMVNIYERHREDLKTLKEVMLKIGKKEYDEMFKPTSKNVVNYYNYVNPVACSGDKTDGFYKYVKKAIEKSDDSRKDEILQKIANETYMLKQTSKNNAYIPYQMQKDELIKILDHQEKYYPVLKENRDKIISILEFRIPYYYGPLDGNKQFGWLIKKKGKENERILPWNHQEIVDVQETAAQFIKKLTNYCTYLPIEKVMPQKSLTCSMYEVLSEVNKIRIDGKLLSIDTKNRLIEDLFFKRKTVKEKDLINWLKQNQLTVGEITGYQKEKAFSSSLAPWIDFKEIFDEINDSNYDLIEKIIEDMTIFNEGSILKERLKKAYNLDQNKVKKIMKLKYSGWSRLSKKLINGIRADNKFGSSVSILEVMKESHMALMEIINDQDLGFKQIIEKENFKNETGSFEYEDIENLAGSPALKRGIWQTLQVIEEIKNYMGHEPKNIYIEFAREEQEKVRTTTRVKKLKSIYNDIKNQLDVHGKEVYSNLNKQDEKSSIEKRLYLYYTQLGKCMYSGESLDIDKLSDYEIDHIFPRTLTSDDSLDNLVLVKKKENQRKLDDLVLPLEIRNKMEVFWKKLYDNGLITQTKYYRLMRDEFRRDQIDKFINRQLVETRQIIKHVANIIENHYEDTKVFTVRANLSHEFREKYGIYKNRNVNDFHHAHDAYIACIIGRYIQIRFPGLEAKYVYGQYMQNVKKTKNNIDKENHGFIINSMKYECIDEDTGEVIWNPERILDYIKCFNYRDVYITKKLDTNNRELFNVTILPNDKNSEKGKTKATIPVNKLRSNVRKYGGFSGLQSDIVAIEGKKGKKIDRRLINLPILLRYVSIEDQCKYIMENNKYSDIKIIKKIKKNQLIEIDGGLYYLSSATELVNAHQLILNNKENEIIFEINNAMIKNDYSYFENREIEITKLYNLLCDKMKKYYPKYKGIYEKILTKNIDFNILEIDLKCRVILEVLKILKAGAINGNLKFEPYNMADREGRLSKQSIHLDNTYFYDVSITGIYSKKYKL
ncbi:type II CRISPR RNA-guided endonuclease Cas9 [Coprobacillus sp. OM08-19]|jgi:CRISPR-associated endonuclease Csn1|nr:type II CRISPR RNA-guided endonuclease Cas9 [Coprobacillus sp. AF27-24BH]RGH52329.1 type II CRISPR RNA-guided endonuclease Cas9 [Coprobacillus sp. AM37-9BH]RGI22212.1 type II CRISPR RNA-guided endonuclease Cas9 [Coprobacillus sp. OM08-19]RHQ17389.1 type II CRISPR RNA-guided endonuclease Cas9 [Coprobacillus sp. AF29-3BH]